MAGRSVRTFPGASLSLSFQIKAALQNPWRERRVRLQRHTRAQQVLQMLKHTDGV